jgi:hypothetical protein
MRWARLVLLGSLLGWTPSPMAAEQASLAIEAPPPDLARIYFYRQAAPLLLALAPEVIVNGRSVGSLGMGEVFFRDAKPGRYEIFLEDDTDHVIELQLAPGEIGYVRATLRLGFGTTRISAERIAATAAVGEILAMDAPKEVPEPQEHR